MAARIPYPATTPKYFAVASEVTILAFLRSIGGLPTPESKVTLITFPASGSLYFTEDLANATWRVTEPTSPGISLKDKHANTEATLRREAEKEIAYLRRFGRPLPLFKQQPSDHIENLERYLHIMSSLTAKDLARDRVCIHRPDFQPSNIIVPLSSVSSSYVVVGLIDWQHPSDLPLSLQAGISQWLQNYDDAGREPMTPSSLPEKLSDLGETRRREEMELYHCRLLHYYYIEYTAKYNILHYAAVTGTFNLLLRHIFYHSWLPCPIVFDDPDDVRKMMELDVVLRKMDGYLVALWDKIGVGSEGWVPAEHYKEVMARRKKIKEHALAAIE
ncbi:hypothetical protein F5141DRAFT_1197895 [Pisolithus sp. B1]|nr:hypothetical protein F5141DRAFT_1197895 [Pisolithus sp. B1]